MELKKSNTITALMRKSLGLPANGSNCCGGRDEAGTASAESTGAEKSSDADACCGSNKKVGEER